MKKVPEDVIWFFEKQDFVIVSTVDSAGGPHSVCKGLLKISPEGKFYIMDLFRGNTFRNMNNNPRMSITAVDEHQFKGYCLKGRASIIPGGKIPVSCLKAWRAKITNRITSRIIRNIHGESGHSDHPEHLLPDPKYIIVMELEEIFNLAPY
jgi:predicted pyridoxine 5'-phosphate oxidase superfamily flavin-nucleotide-binding protein